MQLLHRCIIIFCRLIDNGHLDHAADPMDMKQVLRSHSWLILVEITIYFESPMLSKLDGTDHLNQALHRICMPMVHRWRLSVRNVLELSIDKFIILLTGYIFRVRPDPIRSVELDKRTTMLSTMRVHNNFISENNLV